MNVLTVNDQHDRLRLLEFYTEILRRQFNAQFTSIYYGTVTTTTTKSTTTTTTTTTEVSTPYCPDSKKEGTGRSVVLVKGTSCVLSDNF